MPATEFKFLNQNAEKITISIGVVMIAFGFFVSVTSDSKSLTSFIPSCLGLILFILGVLFGYYIITPLSLNFLSNFTVSDIIINDINFISFVKTITKFILLCGFVFQLPFVIYFLAKFNLVTKKLLQIYRKHAFVIVLILSSIITPPDVLSQILIAFPLMILYEISIIVVHYVHKKNKT